MSTAAKIAACLLVGLALLPYSAFAKRTPAPVIEPIVYKGVRYTVPNDKGTVGYVVASDAASGKTLWKKTVFRKRIFPLLEHDVQWVFIKQMRLDGERLLIVDERGHAYSLDLKTRKVKTLKRTWHEKGRTSGCTEPGESASVARRASVAPGH